MHSGTIISANRIVYHTLDQKSFIITLLVNTVLKLSNHTNSDGNIDFPSNLDIDMTTPKTSGKTKNRQKQKKYGPKKNNSDPVLRILLFRFSLSKA